VCKGVFGCSFGDDAFLALAGGERWDLLCHHAADVTNYKSPSFDVTSAVASNTRNVAAVVDTLKRKADFLRILVTGSFFENDEGVGSDGLPAFSPYGLSKGLTWQVFRYHASRAAVSLGKFVVPHPFGAYEDPRFTAYLFKNWLNGATATVNTPAYVRDNAHVTLLAKAYVRFAENLPATALISRTNPSCYPESQGAFAQRFANEMRKRLGLPCVLELRQQVDFQEPRLRINTDPVDGDALGWNESCAWDEIAEYYSAVGR
jgi:nucleoside-diphosphate-sugar epimerase